MENQIEKFARLCDVFNFRVYDINLDYVRVEKGQLQMLIGKYLLSNDYHLIRTLLEVYSEFREYEQKKVRNNYGMAAQLERLQDEKEPKPTVKQLPYKTKTML